jgi:hypothetical protein
MKSFPNGRQCGRNPRAFQRFALAVQKRATSPSRLLLKRSYLIQLPLHLAAGQQLSAEAAKLTICRTSFFQIMCFDTPTSRHVACSSPEVAGLPMPLFPIHNTTFHYKRDFL